LPAQARALYIELSQRYNGSNNGEISMSIREAVSLVHIAKDTASKYFYELEEKGFIQRNVCGSFNYKLRHATTWFLTQHPIGDVPATKDFMSWRPKKPKHGPNPGTKCPKRGTQTSIINSENCFAVLNLGPRSLFCTASRSQITARI